MPIDGGENVGLHISWEGDDVRTGAGGSDATIPAINLPLRILFCGDMSPSTPTANLDQRLATNLRPGELPALLADWRPRLRLDVPNKIGPAPNSLGIDITFSTAADFSVSGIRGNIPAVAECDRAADALDELARGLLDVDRFRDRLLEGGVQPSQVDALVSAVSAGSAMRDSSGEAYSPSPSSDSRIDQLLELVDLPDSEAETPNRGGPGGDPVDRLAEAVVGETAGERINRHEAARLAQSLRKSADEQMDAVLANRNVVSFLRGWKSVLWLLKRLPFRSGVRLDVLSARRSHLVDAVETFLEDDSDPIPAALVVLDVAFSHSHSDVESLDRLGAAAAEYGTLTAASADPALLGADNRDEISVGPSLWQRFGLPEYGAWRSLRESTHARHVGLFLHDLLLERIDPPGSLLPSSWGTGALALAAAAASGFSEFGWSSRLDGPIEDLPLRPDVDQPSALSPASPVTESDVAGGQGLALLSAARRPDEIRLSVPQSLWRAPRYESREATDEYARFARLDTQLFFVRVGQLMRAVLADPPVTSDTEQLVTELQRRVESIDGLEDVSIRRSEEASDLEGAILVRLSCRAAGTALIQPVRLGASFIVPLARD
jgi:type VI secretion system ImpB/VipA family protein